MNFGEYVERLLKERGKSKAWLATELGVNWKTVNSWNANSALPKGQQLAGVIALLKPSAEEQRNLLELATKKGVRESAAAPELASMSLLDDPLDDIVTRNFDKERHRSADSTAVIASLREATKLVSSLSDPDTAARAWLDAAAELRRRQIKPSAAAIAVLSHDSGIRGELAASPPVYVAKQEQLFVAPEPKGPRLASITGGAAEDAAKKADELAAAGAPGAKPIKRKTGDVGGTERLGGHDLSTSSPSKKNKP